MTSRPPKKSTLAIAIEGRNVRPGQVARLDAGLAQRAGAHALGALAEALPHLGLAPERLHHLHADDRLVRRLGEVGLALLDDARERRHEPREAPGEQRDQRHREARVERQPGVDAEQHDRDADDHHHARADLHDAPADEVADRVEVVGRAREHLPGRVAVVERARIGEVGVVERGAQAVLDHDADARGDRAPRRVGREAQAGADRDQRRGRARARSDPSRRSSCRSRAGPARGSRCRERSSRARTAGRCRRDAAPPTTPA